MENASKALLIAGAVLLAMIVVSAIVMVQRNMGDALKQQDKSLEAKQLAEFNMRYKSYEKNIRGIDLRSLMNMADNDNIKDSRQIVIEFSIRKDLDKAANESTELSPKITCSNIGSGKSKYQGYVLDNEHPERLTNFNKRVFGHVTTSTDGTGRIEKMIFEEIIDVTTNWGMLQGGRIWKISQKH